MMRVSMMRVRVRMGMVRVRMGMVRVRMGMAKKSLLLALLVLLVFCCCVSECSVLAGTKSVNVQLKTRWNRTSIASESLEFIASARGDGRTSDVFFDSVAWLWDARSGYSVRQSERAESELVSVLVRDVLALGGGTVGMLSFSQALHYYSPRIAMFQQMRQSHLASSLVEFVAARAAKDGDRQALQVVKTAYPWKRWAQCASLLFWPSGDADLVLSPWHCLDSNNVKDADGFVESLASRYESGTHSSSSQDDKADLGRVLPDLDHSLRGSESSASTPSPAVVVLYGDVDAWGSHAVRLLAMHRKLVTMSKAGRIVYVIRPMSSFARTSEPLSLSGFGVELAIKNMEYKVIDDTKIELDDDESEMADEANKALLDQLSDHSEHDVYGFLFDTLNARKPDLAEELGKLKAHLVSSHNNNDDDDDSGGSGVGSGLGGGSLKKWDVKDLGYQASQRIVASGDPLRLMRDIAQNFPAIGRTLAKLTVDKSVKAEILHNQHIIQQGHNAISINGFTMDPDEFDVYDMHEFLRREAQYTDALRALGFSPATIRRLLRVPLPTGGSVSHAASAQTSSESRDEKDVRLDMDASRQTMKRRRGVIAYVNDLEKPGHPIYSRWANTVRGLLTRGWPNQLRYVAKNLYTGILVIDPSRRQDLRLFERAKYFVDGNAPIRIGVVFNVQPVTSAVTATSTLVDAFWRSSVAGRHTLLLEAAGLSSPHDVPAASSGDVPSRESLGAVIAKCFHYLYAIDSDRAWSFLARLAEMATSKDMTLTRVKRRFVKLLKKHHSNPRTLWSAITATSEAAKQHAELQRHRKKANDEDGKEDGEENEQPDFDAVQEGNAFLSRSRAYVRQRGLAGTESMLVVNGLARMCTGDSFREKMMELILSEQQMLQMMVYHGKVTDDTDLQAHLAKDAYPRKSAHIVQPVAKQQYVKTMHLCTLHDIASHLHFLSAVNRADTDSMVKAVTFVMVSDFATPGGLSAVAGALQHLEQMEATGDTETRVGFVPSSSRGYDVASAVYATIKHGRARSMATKRTLRTVRELLQIAAAVAGDSPLVTKTRQELLADVMHSRGITAPSPAMWDNATNAFRAFVSSEAALGQGDINAVIVNGRVISLPDDALAAADPDAFAMDLELLVLLLSRERHLKDVQILVEHEIWGERVAGETIDSNFISNRIHDAHMVLARRCQVMNKHDPHLVPEGGLIRTDHSVLRINVPESPDALTASLISVEVLLDPLSRAAQRITPLLLLIRDVFKYELTVYLNPRNDLSDMPLKRYYRFVLPGAARFHEGTGAMLPSGGALFRSMMTKHVLTMNVDTPESWMVASWVARHDLDNIKLRDLGSNTQMMYVVYGLEHLLLAGQCFDTTQRDAAAGLQLVLGSFDRPHIHDTVVMQNLGYFQLQAGPGVWNVRLAHGKHSDVFRIVGADERHDNTKQLWVTSFHDKWKVIKVARRPGQEHAKLSEPSVGQSTTGAASAAASAAAQAINSMWTSVTGMFGGGSVNVGGSEGDSHSDHDDTSGNDDDDDDKRIHVFSVASGHLYERFLKIMMLSVVKNTDAPVKFWFIKNFASPQFKQFVPKMAKRYGYQVEFVTYKWPKWLRRQRVKQRIIWGHKILFLDVLFPLKLKRVIFCDADQIVRGDLAELRDLNMRGAPYGFTPFCDSNHKTEGFRFWKQGYWRNHLQGKPYHISALFVVNLERFRHMRAGDKLRIMYDNLSQDENSLSNLDQDLPNYAQHQVPIFSLSQEWLWCETWCSMSTLSSAKAIDLCNNPLTKRPKLDVARELVPEWVGLDNEASLVVAETNTETARRAKVHVHAEL